MSDTSRSRIYQGIVVVLLLVIAAMAYKFVVSGSTQKGDDERIAIMLSPGERALVLREMRGFVFGIQLITDALSRDDIKGVANAARDLGMSRMHDAPVAMMGKLPLGFKTLALGVHRGFDGIAMDADSIGTPKHSLAQLADVLRQCVACHAAYQLRVEVPK